MPLNCCGFFYTPWLEKKMSESLGEAIPKEQARVRDVLARYHEIGPAGRFGAMMIEDTLRRTDEAVMSGDVVAMTRCYSELRDIED